LRYLAWAVIGACVVMTFVGGWQISVTSDEPFHVQRFNNYLQTGWYLTDGQLDHGDPAAGVRHQYVYGPATMLVLHGVNAVVGVEPWAHAGASADAYAARHLTVGAFGVLGLLAVVMTGRVLFRRWDWGVVAGALMASVPLWTGNAMFNLKDVPVATGYAWVTLGLVALARDHEAARWWVRWGGLVVLTGGVVLAVGTRPAMWSGVAFGALVLLFCRGLRREPARWIDRLRADLWVLRDLVVVGSVSWLLLWWMDPKVFGSPTAALMRSVSSSATFRDKSSPWVTVPSYVATEMPVLVIASFVVGCVLVGRRVLATRMRLDVATARPVVVCAQATSMPVGFMITQAPLNYDLRQLLFALPATAVVAAWGVACLLGSGGGTTRSRASAVAVSVGLVVPTVAQASLFPYNYAFVNSLSAVAHAPTSGAYYGGSANVLMSSVPVHGRLVCAPEFAYRRTSSGATVRYVIRAGRFDGWVDCAVSTGTVTPYVDRRAGTMRELAPDEFRVIGAHGASNCTQIAGLSRRGLWQSIQLSSVALCRLPFPRLSMGTVSFGDHASTSMLIPDRGWLAVSSAPGMVGLSSAGRRSTMTFRLPSQARDTVVELTIETAGTADPRITFGGVSVPVHRAEDPSRLVVEIPRDLVDRSLTQPLTLAFESRTSADLDLDVLSLSVQSREVLTGG
jgi:hypothetical protein